MKNRSIAATVAISAVLVSVLLASVKAFSEKREAMRGFGFSVTTDKATYRSGEPIILEFKIFNHTAGEVVFHFRNAQRCDRRHRKQREQPDDDDVFDKGAAARIPVNAGHSHGLALQPVCRDPGTGRVTHLACHVCPQ